MGSYINDVAAYEEIGGGGRRVTVYRCFTTAVGERWAKFILSMSQKIKWIHVGRLCSKHDSQNLESLGPFRIKSNCQPCLIAI